MLGTEKGQLNILPGAQALSSSFAFMVPKTGSAAETLSFRQRVQEKAMEKWHVTSPQKCFSP